MVKIPARKASVRLELAMQPVPDGSSGRAQARSRAKPNGGGWTGLTRASPCGASLTRSQPRFNGYGGQWAGFGRNGSAPLTLGTSPRAQPKR